MTGNIESSNVGPPTALPQSYIPNASEMAKLDEIGKASNRLRNAALDKGNLFASSSTAAGRAVLTGGVGPASAIGFLTGVAAEAYNIACENSLSKSDINLAPIAAQVFKLATVADADEMVKFFAKASQDPAIRTVWDLDQAWDDLQQGLAVSEKWWLPVQQVWRRARKQPMTAYYLMGVEHGKNVSRPFAGNKGVWKQISALLAQKRAAAMLLALDEMYAAENDTDAAPISQVLAAIPYAHHLAVDPTRGTPTGPCACTDGRPAATTVAAPAGPGGSVADVQATATLGLETLRRAAAMVSVAQQALAEASRRFAFACDGSREQAPKDVIASYDAADTNLASVAPALAGAESNVRDWIDGL